MNSGNCWLQNEVDRLRPRRLRQTITRGQSGAEQVFITNKSRCAPPSDVALRVR
jgi:hypothetical protein